MRRHTDRFSNLQVGLVAVVLIVIGCYFGFTKAIPFHHGYRVKAVFASAASEIRTNSPVRIAGVNVGKVTGVERGPGGTALVELELRDSGRPLHRDTTMKLRPRLFLEGNFFVDVKPGSASEPELKEGATIPLAQTAIPVQFDELLSVFTQDTRVAFRDLLRGFADSLDEGGAAALNEGFDEFEDAFRQTAISTEALRGQHSGDLAGFVRNQARISGQLARNREDLGSLVSAYRVTLDAFADRQQALRATIRGLDDVLAAAPPALAALDAALPPLRGFVAALRPGLRIAPPILDRSRPFLSALAGVLASDRLPAFARDLRPAARGLARLNTQLPPLLKLVDPVSRCVTNNIVPALNKQVPDGHLSSDQPAWQDGIRSAVGLVGAQANFDGNGTHTRYYGLAVGQNVVASRLTVGDQLVALAQSPMLGSRPPYTPGKQPPLNGGAPCEDQAVPDLNADTTPPPANQRRIRLKPVKPWTRAQLARRLAQAAKQERAR